MNKKMRLFCGIASLIMALVVAGLAIWDIVGQSKQRFIQIELPGFHEVNLTTPGMYVGIYQHEGQQPIPAAQLSQLSVQLMSPSSFEPLPIMMITSGQTFSQFGFQGMPLFSFVVQEPGLYSLSGVYAHADGGPNAKILLMSEAVQNVKPTLIVGILFFGLFLWLGIWLILKNKKDQR